MKKIYWIVIAVLILGSHGVTNARIIPECISIDDSIPCSTVLPIKPIKPISPDPILPAKNVIPIDTKGCSIGSLVANPSRINSGDSSRIVAQTDCKYVLWLDGLSQILSQPTAIDFDTGALTATTTYTVVASNELYQGCTSLSGYSNANGQPCVTFAQKKTVTVLVVPKKTSSGDDVSDGLPTGCTTATGYSVTTGQPCGNVGVNQPIGCTTTSLFSPVTGAPCTSWSYGVPVKPSIVSGYTSSNNYSRTRRLVKGLKGDDVVELQKLLTREGVYSGAIDGSFGQMTKVAVQRFQAKHDLNQDGAVGPMTLMKLNQ